MGCAGSTGTQRRSHGGSTAVVGAAGAGAGVAAGAGSGSGSSVGLSGHGHALNPPEPWAHEKVLSAFQLQCMREVG